MLQKIQMAQMSILLDLPLSWALNGWPERSLTSCQHPLGHGKEPMLFLGSALRTRACTKGGQNLSFVQAWTWWVPGSRLHKALNHEVRKTGRKKREDGSGHGRERELVLQENNNLCDGEVFLLDRNLLMSAIVLRVTLLKHSNQNLPYFSVNGTSAS